MWSCLLWLRDLPSSTVPFLATIPRITLLVGDLRRTRKPHARRDVARPAAVPTARPGGIPRRAIQVNVCAVKELLGRTDPARLEQVHLLLHRPASLDRDLNLLPKRRPTAPNYIPDQALCLQQLGTHPLR